LVRIARSAPHNPHSRSRLGRDLLMASVFGANALTDAFNVAFRIPNLLRRLFAEGAFSQAFVPVLAASRAQQGDAAARALVAQVSVVLVWVLLAVCVLGVLGAPLLVWLLASGLRAGEGFDAAVRMTRWMFPYIACMSLVALAAGALNTFKRFALPAATPVLLNLSMIAAAALGAPYLARRGIEPIYAMAAGVMLGGVLQLGIQIPALARLRLLPRMCWRNWRLAALRAAWQQAGVRRIAALMAPALLGVGVAQVSLLINTQIASWLAAGSVTWLFYADRLMEFPAALLGVALGVVLTPQLAQAQAGGDAARYAAMLDWGLRLVLVLAAPCAVALLVFAEPLVATLFARGALTAGDVRQIALALSAYGVGLLGLIAVKVLAPGYYARQDIRTPVKIAAMVLLLTQALNAVLVPYLAHAALALSIGLGALANALWLLAGLLRCGAYRPQAGWGLLALQVLAACCLLAALLDWGRAYIDWMAVGEGRRIATLALLLLGSAALYLGALRAGGVRLGALLRGA